MKAAQEVMRRKTQAAYGNVSMSDSTIRIMQRHYAISGSGSGDRHFQNSNSSDDSLPCEANLNEEPIEDVTAKSERVHQSFKTGLGEITGNDGR